MLERPAQRSCAGLLRRPVAQSSAKSGVAQWIGTDLRCRRASRVCTPRRHCVQTLRADASANSARGIPDGKRTVITHDCQGDRVRVHRVRSVGSRLTHSKAELSGRPVSGIADASVCRFSFGSLSRARGSTALFLRMREPDIAIANEVRARRRREVDAGTASGTEPVARGSVRQPLLSPADLAAYLAVPLATVYRWRSRSEGPRGYRVGRHVRYRLDDVERWLEGRVDAS